ncbi:MAG: EF-hand domain-containing protein, partial [Akkermansia sp.]|nr:EF-hand domain-containing protein [Akkermansia sp.]
MKKYILIAALASLPLFAQDAPENTPAAPQQGGQPGMPGMHGQRVQRGQRGGMKRGQWNPEQNKELMEKFDTDKDGKLSDEEKKAMRE